MVFGAKKKTLGPPETPGKHRGVDDFHLKKLMHPNIHTSSPLGRSQRKVVLTRGIPTRVIYCTHLLPTGQEPEEGCPLAWYRLHLEEPLHLILGVLDANKGAATAKAVQIDSNLC